MEGILLVNVGTPDSPKPQAVKRYLTQFLTDGRVMDLPWLARQLLVRGQIIPRRYRDSASAYQKIWTKEGSPLLAHGEKVVEQLQQKLGSTYQVELAMRYGNPSIPSKLTRLKGCQKITVIPLFPQYASATTGTAHAEILRLVQQWQVIPELRLLSSYPTQKKMVAAFCEQAKKWPLERYDHILLSFHGLPERQIQRADTHGCCLQSNCCKKLTPRNHHCYSAHCHATAEAIARGLSLPLGRYSIAFQSRLGKDPWLKPYASEELDRLLQLGKRRLLVISPAFVADCLETLYEIGIEYREEFLKKGGEALDLVEGLNTHPLWIEALLELAVPPNGVGSQDLV